MLLCRKTTIVCRLAIHSNTKILPVAIRRTNKLGAPSIFLSRGSIVEKNFVKLKTLKTFWGPWNQRKKVNMFGNFSAVTLLLWLLAALLFNQIEAGNNSVSSSKVRLHKWRAKTGFFYRSLLCPIYTHVVVVFPQYSPLWNHLRLLIKGIDGICLVFLFSSQIFSLDPVQADKIKIVNIISLLPKLFVSSKETKI